jgi:hypothetical protein
MREEKIPAIGCGTSLGIKNRPTSYNMLRWSPSEKKWNVSFYSDPDGTGFREELLELHTVKVWEL